MNVVIANRQPTRKINLRRLKKIVAALLAKLKIENAELEIVLAGTKEMARLNEKFLRHEGPTDVITFDYLNSEFRIWNLEFQLHGEIFVCVDEAILQAKKFKTSWQSEVIRYIVHGVLHLSGHDDSRPAVRSKMKREENRLLRELSRQFSLAQPVHATKLAA